MSLMVLIVVGIGYEKPTDWWASASQWVGGVGSIAAAGVALWGAIEGWVQAQREREEVRQREQVSKCAVWIDWLGQHDIDPNSGEPLPYPGAPVV
jgi:hypothetical protein